MNWLDVVLLLILVGGMLWGMLDGAIKQFIGIFSLYVGLVASLWIYPELSSIIGTFLPTITPNGRDTVAFLFLFILIANLLGLAIRFSATPPEERRRKKQEEEGVQQAVKKGAERFILAPLNHIGGLIIGFVKTTIWMGIIINVIQFSVSGDPWLGYDGLRRFLLASIQGAQLKSILELVFYYVYVSVKYVSPGQFGGQLPTVFRNLIGQF